MTDVSDGWTDKMDGAQTGAITDVMHNVCMDGMDNTWMGATDMFSHKLRLCSCGTKPQHSIKHQYL